LLPLDFGYLSVKIVSKVFEGLFSALIGDPSRQPSNVFSAVAQPIYFAHDTVLITGGSVRNLFCGGGVALSRWCLALCVPAICEFYGRSPWCLVTIL